MVYLFNFCFKETGGNPVIYKVRKVEGVFPSSLSLSSAGACRKQETNSLSASGSGDLTVFRALLFIGTSLSTVSRRGEIHCSVYFNLSL
ncbi:hypothetical protein AAC387_Pa05g2375 [Persea americana]